MHESEGNTTTNTNNFNSWAAGAVAASDLAAEVTDHPVTGTIHLFRTLLRSGIASNLLVETFGVNSDDVASIIRRMPKLIPQGIGPAFLMTDGLKKVLQVARELSLKYGLRHNMVYTEHLLLALIEVMDEQFAALVKELGIDIDALTAALHKSLKWKTGMATA